MKISIFIFIFILLASFIYGGFFVLPKVTALKYTSEDIIEPIEVIKVSTNPLDTEAKKDKNKTRSRAEVPKPLRAIYITSWVAGTLSWRNSLIELVEETNINAVVIDIKDDTGRISFEVNDPKLSEIGSWQIRIKDIEELVNIFHDRGVYVIGRVSVFQDPYLVSKRPDLAVLRESDRGIWQDRKGLTWLDPGSKEVWDYAVSIAREAHARGFDEINFDYIRFPSDGNMRDIYYPKSEGKRRSDVMEDFYKYLYAELKDEIVISADLFGLVTVAEDDLGIGQELLRAIPYFDYIAPMVYPSHFANGTFGIASPASNPYEIIFESMSQAIKRITATSTVEYQLVGTTTEAVVIPRESFPKEKLRPWLQYFDLGAEYTPSMIRAQIQAVYDAGLDSWMLWDPSNRYKHGASFVE